MNSLESSPQSQLYEACIHCGLCLSACPTYLETGNENESPRGRIYLMRAIQEARIELSAAPVRHIDSCLGCRACEAVCPSGVRYGALLEETRDHFEKSYRRPLWQRLLRRIAVEKVFPFPNRMRVAVWPALILRKLGGAKFLPRFIRDCLDLLPQNLSGGSLPEQSPPLATGSRGRVGFVSGCVMTVFFGKTNEASVRLLNRAGWDVVTPRHQVCCGALFSHGGQLEKARECARRNIEAFENLNLEAVIINAAGCGSTLKDYAHLLEYDSQFCDRARVFSSKVRDLTEFLVQHRSDPRSIPLSHTNDNRKQVPPLSPTGGEGKGEGAKVSNAKSASVRVTFHDACHLAHAQRITKAPRELLRSDPDVQIIELCESDVCCGSAGSYNLTEPAMAERLQRRKIQNILKTDARIVVTTNPGCILQIRAGLLKAGRGDIEVLHIADYLDR